jgi:hypothetical protein
LSDQRASVRLGDGPDPRHVGPLIGSRWQRAAASGLAHRHDEVLESGGGADEEHAAAGVSHRVTVRDVPRAEEVVAGAGLDRGVADLEGRAALGKDDKTRWLFWRPITAIHEADRDGNPATEADATWLPLIVNPPYPDHPSGLSAIGSAMGSTLWDFFGTNRLEFSSKNETLDLTRSYGSFSQAIDEIVDARVWSGIHFRIADVQAAKIGRQIARYRKQHYFHAIKPRACEDDDRRDDQHNDEEDEEDDKHDH